MHPVYDRVASTLRITSSAGLVAAGQQGLRRAAVAGKVPERRFLFTRSVAAVHAQALPVLSLVKL